MKFFNKRTWLLTGVLFASTAGMALAEYEYSPAELSRTNPMSRAGHKLGRGVSNTFLGWVELPKGIETVGRESGFAASITWGVLQGAGAALARTAAGIVEVGTFPFPVTSKDNEPLIQPEYIL